jgi:regulator of replication initiation timing
LNRDTEAIAKADEKEPSSHLQQFMQKELNYLEKTLKNEIEENSNLESERKDLKSKITGIYKTLMNTKVKIKEINQRRKWPHFKQINIQSKLREKNKTTSFKMSHSFFKEKN